MDDRKPSAPLRVDAAGLTVFLEEVAARHAKEEITFLCIGTDRSTGDSLGPWVGTMLEEQGFTRVIGTLRSPCDAYKLPQLIASFEEMGTIIAVDACLGKAETVGAYMVAQGPIIPARSVGRGFAPVGAYSIAGVVNRMSAKPYWTLQSTSLYQVMGMAREITEAITRSYNKRKDG